ncbi:hypothetical protein, partial [Coprococcus sp. AM100_B19A]|uniref:hypothetical protein n=1 Tax=Coprococcus sp. AM100_B19A TaxID=2997949 RepID=UPI002ED51572
LSRKLLNIIEMAGLCWIGKRIRPVMWEPSIFAGLMNMQGTTLNYLNPMKSHIFAENAVGRENNIRFHLGLNCGMSVCQLESMNIQENGNDIRIDIEQFCLRMCKAAKNYYDKVHLEKDFSLYNTPVLDFIQVTQKKKAASIIALVCGSERYAKGLKETLQFISDQIMLFYTPESAKTRLGRHKPDLWIVTEDMTSQPNQPWRADRTTPVILIAGNPDAVEIKKNAGKLTVLSMPLSIVDLRKTVEIYVS